jgi:hypothetical protein
MKLLSGKKPLAKSQSDEERDISIPEDEEGGLQEASL